MADRVAGPGAAFPKAVSRSTSSTTVGTLASLATASTAVADTAGMADADGADAAGLTGAADVADVAAMAARVRALYDAGVPLFTREALIGLARQLDQDHDVRAGRRNTTVTVCGMDGRRVQLETRSGAVSATPVHPDIVLVNVKPQIDYWTVEKLTGRALWHVRRFDPARSFLPLRISHVQEARHRDASGAISARGSSTVAELASSLAASLALTQTPALAAEAPPARPRPGVDDVRSLFRRRRAEWEASEACQQLRATLFASMASQLVPRGRAAVRKVVAFACSSMSDEREGGSARHAVQHALVLTVRDVLEAIQSGAGAGAEAGPPAVAVQCFVQDPAYDAADRAVLAEAGLSVLDDPHGFLAVDASTVVISIAPSVPVRQIVADLARPAAMVWGRVVRDSKDSKDSSSRADAPPPLVDDMGGWSDPASPRVKQMIESGYAEFDFPSDPHNFGTVDGVAIYVRTSPPLRPPAPAPTPAPPPMSAGLLQRLQRTLLCQPVE